MADYVIPPKTTIVKCKYCKTLYVPDMEKNHLSPARTRFFNFESCPTCGCEKNDFNNTIPLWMYNLIKFFRGGFHGNTGDQRGNPESGKRP